MVYLLIYIFVWCVLSEQIGNIYFLILTPQTSTESGGCQEDRDVVGVWFDRNPLEEKSLMGTHMDPQHVHINNVCVSHTPTHNMFILIMSVWHV